MTKLFALFIACSVLLGFGFAAAHPEALPVQQEQESEEQEESGDEEQKPHEKLSIAEIMEDAHDSGLLKKVMTKNASKKEKMELLNLYIDLMDNTPGKGEKNDWLIASGRVVAAAGKVALGRKDAEKELRKVIDCKKCHDAFKE